MTKAKILGVMGNGVGWPELPLAIQLNDMLWITCRTLELCPTYVLGVEIQHDFGIVDYNQERILPVSFFV